MACLFCEAIKFFIRPWQEDATDDTKALYESELAYDLVANHTDVAKLVLTYIEKLKPDLLADIKKKTLEDRANGYWAECISGNPSGGDDE